MDEEGASPRPVKDELQSGAGGWGQVGEQRGGGSESTVQRGDFAGDMVQVCPELVIKPGEDGPVSCLRGPDGEVFNNMPLPLGATAMQGAPNPRSQRGI